MTRGRGRTHVPNKRCTLCGREGVSGYTWAGNGLVCTHKVACRRRRGEVVVNTSPGNPPSERQRTAIDTALDVWMDLGDPATARDPAAREAFRPEVELVVRTIWPHIPPDGLFGPGWVNAHHRVSRLLHRAVEQGGREIEDLAVDVLTVVLEEFVNAAPHYNQENRQ